MAGVAKRELSRGLFTVRECFDLPKSNHTNGKQYDREVCVTVGLSSEVYLLPTSNKICDFCLFFE